MNKVGKSVRLALMVLLPLNGFSQLNWINVDSLFSPLPASVHVYRSNTQIDGKPNIAYYVEADLKDRSLEFTTDTTTGRRLSPQDFYSKNDRPLVTVNCTFFSFATNQNLNTVIRNGELLGYNIHSVAGRGKDTLTYRHPLGSAIGITKKRKADIAWLVTDSTQKYAYASQKATPLIKDSIQKTNRYYYESINNKSVHLKKWQMQTAVGGGPVLVQNGQVSIANNEEWKFPGKAIDDKHPRTAMGYTSKGKLIILVIEGRNQGIAEGASLTQTAIILKDIGCIEALNLDGGGSSCMLVNGKTTIYPSDKGVQRPVPAVFIIK